MNNLKSMKNLSLIICFFALCSCHEPEKPEFDSIWYKFHDSSVPPEYHRSYTIVLSKGSIEKLVDSYGDTISYQSNKVDPGVIQGIHKVFEKANIEKCQNPTDDEGCSGGTAVSIRCFRGKHCTFEGIRYLCGGEQTGDLCGNTNEILGYLNRFLKEE